jgi:hypothetical protein
MVCLGQSKLSLVRVLLHPLLLMKVEEPALERAVKRKSPKTTFNLT